MGRLRDLATGYQWEQIPNDVRIVMLGEDARIEALQARIAKADALAEALAAWENAAAEHMQFQDALDAALAAYREGSDALVAAAREEALREAAAQHGLHGTAKLIQDQAARIAALEALDQMDKPRVKPLSWTSKGYAETPFGRYLVVREDWSGQDDFWFVCFAGKPYGKCGEHGSEEAAKAAAQADYEARILAALEPVTVQEARPISDVPDDGTWAVLHPGYYGAFTACALHGKWLMCDEHDLRFATHWMPCPFTPLAQKDAE